MSDECFGGWLVRRITNAYIQYCRIANPTERYRKSKALTSEELGAYLGRAGRLSRKRKALIKEAPRAYLGSTRRLSVSPLLVFGGEVCAAGGLGEDGLVALQAVHAQHLFGGMEVDVHRRELGHGVAAEVLLLRDRPDGSRWS